MDTAVPGPDTSYSLEEAARQHKEHEAGVLLVHGLNGCQSDMAELTELLRLQGLETENMLLPGHGTHVRDMLALGWPDWAEAVKRELQVLKQRCERGFLVGHSLGGALCLYTAAHEEVAGVVTMCAPLYMHPLLEPTVRLLLRFTPVLPTVREDICDPAARQKQRKLVYGWTPMAPLANMLRYLPQLRKELPNIKVPALIIVATHDHVVPARDGREIYRMLGSQEKELLTLHRSYHVVMKDYDHELAFARTLAFIQQHAGGVKGVVKEKTA